MKTLIVIFFGILGFGLFYCGFCFRQATEPTDQQLAEYHKALCDSVHVSDLIKFAPESKKAMSELNASMNDTLKHQ